MGGGSLYKLVMEVIIVPHSGIRVKFLYFSHNLFPQNVQSMLGTSKPNPRKAIKISVGGVGQYNDNFPGSLRSN